MKVSNIQDLYNQAIIDKVKLHTRFTTSEQNMAYRKIKALDKKVAKQKLFETAAAMISKGFKEISKVFDINSNVYTKNKTNSLYGENKSLTKLEQADEELIIKDVEDEMHSLVEQSFDKNEFSYKPDELMAKLT